MCKDPVSAEGPILRSWVSGLQHVFFGRHNLAHNTPSPPFILFVYFLSTSMFNWVPTVCHTLGRHEREVKNTDEVAVLVGGRRGKRGTNGARRRLGLGWWAHSAIYRWYSLELHIWNLCNHITNVTPINSTPFLKNVHCNNRGRYQKKKMGCELASVSTVGRVCGNNSPEQRLLWKRSDWVWGGPAFPPSLVLTTFCKIPQKFAFACNFIWIAFLSQSRVLTNMGLLFHFTDEQTEAWRS